ncbi:LuxR family transcriptional regulator [Streptomyces sp. NPDC006365]|uniref:helix-turn-helix transcriptional regulator n=1 Tax=Streptomyces sp. NPDC006365 TaxID=3364744 RepID=UPI0036BD30F5
MVEAPVAVPCHGGGRKVSNQTEFTPHSSGEAEIALLEIRSLIDSVFPKNQLTSAESGSLLTTTDDAHTALRALADQLGRAERRVDVVLPSDRSGAGLPTFVLSRAPKSVPGGVRIRMLGSQSTAEQFGLLDLKRRRHDLEIRITDALLHGAVIIDGRTVLTRHVKEGTSHAAHVRAPAVVQAFNALFAGAWKRAVPLSLDRIRHEFPQEILICLREGYIDEVAARELSMSVRTYRRHVAEIMRLLGANSRFQAGVFAAEAGLLRSERGQEQQAG